MSTLRRYIKAGKLQYRVENGRYLLFDGEQSAAATAAASGATTTARLDSEQGESRAEAERLRRELQRAREEIAELKTLIAFYEEQPPGTSV